MARRGTSSISDGELQSVVNQRLGAAVGGNLDALTQARTDATLLYDGALPKRKSSDHTGYVSQDVLEAVEARKSTLLETFTGNVKPVQFVPTAPQDIAEAQQATDYVDNVVFNQNDGYFILHDVIHDSLIGRCGITQTWWEKNTVSVPQRIQLPTQDAVMVWLQQAQGSHEEIQDVTIEVDATTGECSVEYTQVVDKGKVKIEVVPTEEFFISPRATSLEEADILARRQLRSYMEMKQQGYDVGSLDEWGASNFNEEDTDYSKAVRFWGVDTGLPVSSSDDYHKKISVADCYVKMDHNGQSELWHVVMTCNRVLFKEQVSAHPFNAFVPMRVPHRFWGMSFATMLQWVQESNTILTRSVVNHAMITTNPRWGVLRGALPNPKELVDNRLGGLVNMSRPDAIQALNQPTLNPFVFNTIQKLTADKEVITGTTQLSQGLNKDALSYQNSADMVNQMASMGLGRAKMMARNLERFLAGLYKHVYQVVVENEKASRIIEVSGNFITVDPSKWASGRDVHIKFSVGYGEKEKEAMQLFQFDQYASAQEGMQRMYDENKRFAVWSEIFNKQGYPNVQKFLNDPSKLPPPQPNPAQVMEAQLKQQEAQVKQQDANTRAMAVQGKIAQNQATNSMKSDHMNANTALKAQSMALKAEQDHSRNLMQAAELNSQMDVNHAELILQAHSQHLQAQARPIQVGSKG